MVAREGTRVELRTAPLTVVALVVFVLVDAALVWWAFASVRSDGAASASEGPMPTLPGAASPTAGGTPAPSSAPAAAPEPTAAAGAPGGSRAATSSRYLYAVDPSTAHRGVRGGCPGPGTTFESTTDGGATWTPSPVEFADVRAIAQADADVIVVIARDAATCGLGAFWSFVDGDDWEPAGEYQSPWTADAATVTSPAGQPSTPCGDDGSGVADVAGRGTAEAVALCADGSLVTTSDAGATWSAAPPVEGAVAVAAASDRYLVAVAGSDGCEGLRVIPVGGGEASSIGCLAAEVVPGETAVDVAGDGTIWVWSGDVIARSGDGGATW
ncbi:hypothetical protein GE115_11200 [Agromyces sp. CFH 90414]|uniref:Exo-alpha-sialidase n=1 Tax=Agromyces agglutinans TaxID=2662258 RepID=A0A6I2F9H4_9MICO|nr:hypothetical protein [Agromyces agglutinans]MRG60427.1 hypothetical protein [Agromyces agglutinans]